MLSSGYFVYAWMMQIGIDEGYMPVQPIHYSHKIHSGANKIECKYCHSSARVSKHSGIPSLNVCMNCHKNIAEYNGEEDLENGYDKEFYTNEIKIINERKGYKSVYHLYQFFCEKRDMLNKYLRKNKIDSKIHYPIPLHLHDAAKVYKYKKGQFKNAEKLSKKVISIPVHEFVSKKQLDFIINKIQKFYN